MVQFPPDGSRDPRIEDLTNLWVIHPAGRRLLPLALRLRIPANAVSILGLMFGAAAAAALQRWNDGRWASIAFLLCICWMIADGLDGMIARATDTASDFGRFLDGLCDHLVFALLYLSLAAAIGTPEAWALALAAGAAHALQATVYEGERTRFHRRIRSDPGGELVAPGRNLLVRAYDAVAGSLDRFAAPFDLRLRDTRDPAGLAQAYGSQAANPMKWMALLTNNMRVLAIYLACLAGDPRLFWWLELGPMTVIAVIGVWRHRRVEARLIRRDEMPEPS